MKLPFLPQAAVLLALLGTFAALLLPSGRLSAAPPDDTVRRAQQALRDQGFYYGPIDGASGDETTQAIRRYQIRNGLAVSGQLNAETLRALQINAPPPTTAGSPAPRSPRSEPTPPPLSSPTPTPPRSITGRPDAPRTTTPAPSPPAPDERYRTRPDLRADSSPGSSSSAAPAPGPLPPGAQSPSVPLTGFFARTPYEFAPPAVQGDILRRAQRALGRGGFYNGPADGQPGRRTVAALGEFQDAFGLPRTRRLDTPTLRVLRLMPGAGANLPEPMPARRPPTRPEEFDDDEGAEDEEVEEEAPAIRIRPRPGGPPVYEGRIIR